jgi:hypothetical protein
LRERVVEVHSEPAGGRYRTLMTYAPGDRIVLGAFPDVSLRVEDFV